MTVLKTNGGFRINAKNPVRPPLGVWSPDTMPPLEVTSTARVDNFNADLLDGMDSSAFSAAGHGHDDRYFTETEADNRFLNVSGDTTTGPLLMGGNLDMRGYEIHQGRTDRNVNLEPAFRVTGIFGETTEALDGAARDAACFGTYMHGLFDHSDFRRAYLNLLRLRKGLEPLPPHAYDTQPKDFDMLADWLRDAVDLQRLSTLTHLPFAKDAL